MAIASINGVLYANLASVNGVSKSPYVIFDDWSDDKLTSRTATYGLGVNGIREKVMPEWTGANWSASGGKATSSTNGAEITTPYTGMFTEQSVDMQTQASGYVGFYHTFEDNDNRIFTQKIGTGGPNRARTYFSMSGAYSIAGGTANNNLETVKMTRDGSGNYELFAGGVSLGTYGPDATWPSSPTVIKLSSDTSHTQNIDNLKVQ